MHVPLGKASFEPDALETNFRAVLDELQRAKPASAKGRYLRKITVSSTMGPGVHIDTARLRPETGLTPPATGGSATIAADVPAARNLPEGDGRATSTTTSGSR